MSTDQTRIKAAVARLQAEDHPDFRIAAYVARASAGRWTAAERILVKTVSGARRATAPAHA
jgi:hypothetical protein